MYHLAAEKTLLVAFSGEGCTGVCCSLCHLRLQQGLSQGSGWPKPSPTRSWETLVTHLIDFVTGLPEVKLPSLL